MRTAAITTTLTTFTTLTAFAPAAFMLALGPASARAQVPERGAWAFTGVNVIPMDSERVLPDQNVVVRDGRITAVGPAASTAVPADAQRIDGTGRYLIPGLAEMHGHIPTANARSAEDVLFLYVAAGATTVRGMQGHPSQLELKRRVEEGSLLGPRLWLAAPPLHGNSVPDTAAAERLVREARRAGFDLLKVHEGLSADAYAAIVRTATELGMPWGGHVSEHVGVAGALAAGQSTIDHLDDYVADMEPVDEAKMRDMARATREAGVAVVPTQVLWQVLLGARAPATMIDRPENQYMPRMTVEAWVRQVGDMHASADAQAAAREVRIRNQLLKAMSDEGVLILMGTDAPQLFSVPGFSLYRELPVMVDAGMTPYQVLQTGTVNVAKFFGMEDRAGTIAVGRNADLLLLEANPLEDIRAIERNAGVMIDGRWLPASFLRERLDAIAARNGR